MDPVPLKLGGLVGLRAVLDLKIERRAECDMFVTVKILLIFLLSLSPQGCTNKRMSLDGKLGARKLALPSTVWAAEPRTIDCLGS
jgi:hypothetical protein